MSVEMGMCQLRWVYFMRDEDMSGEMGIFQLIWEYVRGQTSGEIRICQLRCQAR